MDPHANTQREQGPQRQQSKYPAFENRKGWGSLICDSTNNERVGQPAGEIPITNGDPNTYKFSGKERDSESGLDNFGARYNTSSLGRFMTTDPIHIMKQKVLDPQQWNMYAFVRNNPSSFTDPTGMYLVSCSHVNLKCQKAAENAERERQKALKS